MRAKEERKDTGRGYNDVEKEYVEYIVKLKTYSHLKNAGEK